MSPHALPKSHEVPELSAGDFEQIRAIAREKFGLDLRSGKERLVSARLSRHVRQGGFRSFQEYVRHVSADKTGESLIQLINSLSTNHTHFLREKRHFDFLTRAILPTASMKDFSVWSAACSSGEEPYSIAMTVLDSGVRLRNFWMLATDVSTTILAAARSGEYAGERLSVLPPTWISRFFTKSANDSMWKVRPEVKNVITYQRLNLIDAFDPGRQFDLIFCRNVMIYFGQDTQSAVVRRLATYLKPGGYLFVGHSESLSAVSHPLEYVEPAIYRRPVSHGHGPGTQNARSR